MLTAKIGKVVKILVCGMKGVGKTALIEQLVYGNINAETIFTQVVLTLAAEAAGKRSAYMTLPGYRVNKLSLDII
ncbi:NF-kappa-B inhibitor-interacting Ras-like protein isoform X2 [Scaptodrosophila lebanonensis]|uniref:NF-kappa-B inhibitor-interacting Ras-like protein isoform X2 n=1 Tax=Drosophila lebanonensis TaxID=7225 RepID=A0A6J2TWU2_DROLE|nr:NF-kappa-B inhibitor-interacting Ras-like protein isoform X2 [Scaptodrosophila lebanonensis]